MLLKNCARLLLPFILVLFTQYQLTKSSNILGFFATPSRSNFIVHEALLYELAVKGHNVTVTSIYPRSSDANLPQLQNYHHIDLPMSEQNENLINKMKLNQLKNAEENENFLLRLPRTINSMNNIVSDSLNHPIIQQLKSTKSLKFDLIIFGWFFNDFQIGLAGHFQCPSVLLSVIPTIKLTRDFIGSPSGMSYTQNLLRINNDSNGNHPNHMTFFQRVLNFIANIMEFIATEIFKYFILESKYLENFPSNIYPPFDEVRKNVSLVLVGQHFSESASSVVAKLPGLIEVGGLHIKDRPNSLSNELKNWLDTSSKDGVIFFSLGTNINAAQLPAEKLSQILNVFKKLKQKILWKWDDDNMENKSENVMISKWLPQNDILAHPNIRLFISHCGKSSVAEAKYYGVPILGIPIFGDQKTNLDQIVNEGWALRIDYNDLNETTLSTALNLMLSNTEDGQKFRKIVKNVADLYKDRLQHPMDTAVYWIEYVLRHNGAKHLQSQAIHLNWFQLNSLDVIGGLIVVIYLAIWILRMIIKYVWKKWRRQNVLNVKNK